MEKVLIQRADDHRTSKALRLNRSLVANMVTESQDLRENSNIVGFRADVKIKHLNLLGFSSYSLPNS
jgi:hypothetical protein